MLDYAYVDSLEKKYNRYVSKKYFLFFIPLVILLLAIYFISCKFLAKENQTDEVIILAPKSTQEAIIESTQQIVVDEPVSPIRTIDKKADTGTLIFYSLNSPTSPQEEIFFNSKASKKEYRQKNEILPPISSTIEAIPSTSQSSLKINFSGEVERDAQFFENRFHETKQIRFALLASQEYFEAQDFENSLKWALTANELNPRDEQSWIMFAMSNVKLGKHIDAIKALESFLNFNKSTKIENLLEKIKKGEIK